MANFLKWIGGGINKGLDNAFSNSGGGLLKLDLLDPAQRAAGRSAALYDIGGLIASHGQQDPNSAGFMAAQVLEERKRKEQEALLAQQQAKQRVQQQLYGQAYDQGGAQTAAAFALRQGNIPLANATREMVPEAAEPTPLMNSSQMFKTERGFGAYDVNGKFIPAEVAVTPDTDIITVPQADGSVKAFHKGLIKDGQSLAEAKEAERKVIMVEGIPYAYDGENSATPIINTKTGERFHKLPTPTNPQDLLKGTLDLKSSYERNLGPIPELVAQLRGLRETLSIQTGPAAWASISKFNRVNEPDSVTRETEALMTERARSAWDTARALMQKAATGDGLTAEQRVEMMAAANAASKGFAEAYKKLRAQHSEMATGFGLNPSYVVGEELQFDLDKPLTVGPQLAQPAAPRGGQATRDFLKNFPAR